MTKENLLQHLQECCDRMFGCSLEMATEKQVYRAVCVAVRELLEDDRRAFVEQMCAEQRKQVYYMSMEFLVGTSLRNNLYNMGLLEPAGEILHDLGFSLESLCALEPDAGLGNGGLGRLASCYMDAATGLNYPVTGFSIRYEFGIFRQKIVDGLKWAMCGCIPARTTLWRFVSAGKCMSGWTATSSKLPRPAISLSLLCPTICTFPVTAQKQSTS